MIFYYEFLKLEIAKVGWKYRLNQHRTSNPHNFCISYPIKMIFLLLESY
jgi:hypothetical protein